MKKPFLSLLAAAVLTVSTAEGADPSAAVAPAKADPSAEKVVTVKLKFDAAKPGGPVGIESVTPDPVELSLAKKNTVHWVLSPAGAGTLKITMADKGAKPFKAHPASRGERDHSYSDLPAVTAGETKYKYTVTVRADGQKADFVLDPLIIVRP